jgi:hypothetical protein
MKIQAELLRYINRNTLLGAFSTAVVLILAALAFLGFSRPSAGPAVGSTAVVVVIAAPSPTASLTPTPVVTPTPTLFVPPSPLPGVIGIGAYVQISGTGGDGLRLRSGAGLDHPVSFLGWESEVFIVIDGPQDNDGYTWWRLESPYDEGQPRRGWAVSNYLSAIQ